MAEYDCPDCGHNGEPDTVQHDSVTDRWLVTCPNCGTTTLQQDSYEPPETGVNP